MDISSCSSFDLLYIWPSNTRIWVRTSDSNDSCNERAALFRFIEWRIRVAIEEKMICRPWPTSHVRFLSLLAPHTILSFTLPTDSPKHPLLGRPENAYLQLTYLWFDFNGFPFQCIDGWTDLEWGISLCDKLISKRYRGLVLFYIFCFFFRMSSI